MYSHIPSVIPILCFFPSKTPPDFVEYRVVLKIFREVLGLDIQSAKKIVDAHKVDMMKLIPNEKTRKEKINNLLWRMKDVNVPLMDENGEAFDPSKTTACNQGCSPPRRINISRVFEKLFPVGEAGNVEVSRADIEVLRAAINEYENQGFAFWPIAAQASASD